MHVSLALRLPRETASVAVTRRILGVVMDTLGVAADVRYDVEVALTEACENVVEHVEAGDEYDISVRIDDGVCVIEVTDVGRDVDPSAFRAALPAPTAEHGRGLYLIHALTDNVEFASHPRRGTVVHFEKHLDWSPDAPLEHPSPEQDQRRPPPRGGTRPGRAPRRVEVASPDGMHGTPTPAATGGGRDQARS